ncbi:MAG TPA: tetratricopeptide repeat protein [Candidatus Rifleibacterium sp.]|mgnify:CR=1 FL=1|nr:tetratricopeptide repeat protein [Candidatus Rifleibacterium sp.]HPT46955.1 tetratricopeptide repeat protein [Candidatus Rifleibacterium sp.]
MKKNHLTALLLVLPLIFGLTGCSGGVNGEGDNSYSYDVGTPIVRGNAYNDIGWENITKGQYDSAITQFNKVLNDNPTADEKAEANNGVGWAKSYQGELKDGIAWFEKAKDISNDAKVGLAAGYLQKASRSDMEMVVDLLFKQLGKENEHFAYSARRNTGVSNAEAHAMLAYAYASIGENDKAREQLDYAKELDPAYEGTSLEQMATVIEFLLN